MVELHDYLLVGAGRMIGQGRVRACSAVLLSSWCTHIDSCANFLAEPRLQDCGLLLCSCVACSGLQPNVTMLKSAVAIEICAVAACVGGAASAPLTRNSLCTLHASKCRKVVEEHNLALVPQLTALTAKHVYFQQSRPLPPTLLLCCIDSPTVANVTSFAAGCGGGSGVPACDDGLQ